MTDWKYDPSLSPSENRRNQLAARGESIPAAVEKTAQKAVEERFEPDLVPDVLSDRSEVDQEIDRVIDSIDILDAYRRWIGKEVDEKTTSQTEGIKVSCPNPGHRDSHPSAWVNSDKKTWFCGGCQEGGDIYDLGAIKFGFSRPEYKDGKTFHELRREMAEAYGLRTKKVAGEEVAWVEEPADSGEVEAEPVSRNLAVVREEPEEQQASDAEDEDRGEDTDAPVEGQGTVTVLHDKDVDVEDEMIDYPSINWKEIVPPDTFLWEYLSACSNDDSPEEYHFWHGLCALGHAVGRDVYLDDLKHVYGNMMLTLLGGTGYGKSRSRYWLDDVLEEVLPYRDNGLDTEGCKLCPVPGSGENLIKQFEHIATDPSLPKGSPTIHTPVNGIVDFDEFASLLSRAMRPGNILKPVIQEFSDCKNRISISSNTSGTFEAYKPFCSITSTTQPKALRTLLSRYDTGSGFLNRWVFVGGKRKKRESVGGRWSGIRVDLDPAKEHLKRVRAWGSASRMVEFDREGYEAWDEWFHNTIEPIQLNDETDLLPRIGLTMKRILLLFSINEKRTEIRAEDVERIKPLFTYLLRCYGIVNSEIGITQISEITTELLRHIQRIEEKTGRGASARDLQLRLKRKNYSPDMVSKALKTMTELDWIDIDKQKGPGRPTLRYKVVK